MRKDFAKYDDSVAPHIALVFVQLMFGIAPIIGKIALEVFPSYSIVGFRVFGGAATFYVLQRRLGSLALEKKKDYLYFAVFALFGIVMNQLLFFQGLALTTATNTSLLAVLIPVMAVLVSAFVGNELLGWRKITGILIAAAGVVYLIDPRNASFSSTTTQGDILVLLNSLSYAIYLAISKRLIIKYGALKSIAWLFIMASIVNVPIGIYFLQDVNLSEVSTGAWLALAGIIIFPTILAYYWNTWALERVEPGTVAVYVYMQPIIGAAAAILILKEPFSYRLIVAMILIFAGVFLVTRKKLSPQSD
ncbi:MAG: DMT family transporter [Pyrinomonadaceae bacterium]